MLNPIIGGDQNALKATMFNARTLSAGVLPGRLAAALTANGKQHRWQHLHLPESAAARNAYTTEGARANNSNTDTRSQPEIP
jgi:hypothetical protein